MDLDELRRELQNGDEIKVTPDGRIVDEKAPEHGTLLKPNVWAG